MPAEKSEAIVLHTYNLTESSKIAVLLTPSRGKVRAVAKGVRRTKSKFGSALEPMTHIEAQLHFKEGRDLQTLSQAETRDSFPSVRSDLTRLGLASVICELAELVVQENEEATRPFVMVLIALKTLSGMTRNYGSLLISYFLKMLDIAGLMPQTERCARCKAALQGRVYLHAATGGALCPRCSAGLGEPLSAGSLTMMRRLADADWQMLERIRLPAPSEHEITSALNAYIAYHTGRELRSAKFLRALTALK
ncbi:MAG: DNA repair protein RecO [Candidatus Abyssubacteria bacterium]